MVETMLERRRFLQGLAGLGAIGLMPAPLLARTPAAQWANVKAFIEGFVPEKLAGAVAAVARGLGEADYLSTGTLAFDSKVPADPDTLWRVYSMTKPITGMAAMLLIEDGAIALDQPIADFIPGFANIRVLTDPEKSLESRPGKGAITVRHLLTHTAGLGYTIITQGPLLQEYLRLGITPAALSRDKRLDFTSAATAPSLAEFADRLATLPLIADPGTRWSYSVSIDLLGRVIEVASGKLFDAFVQQRIFDPLGMKDSFWQVPASEAGRLATNYLIGPEGTTPADPGATSIYLDKPAFPFGGAGLVMSARDYDRFLRMLQGEGAIGSTRIMKAETARLGMSNLLPEGVDMAGIFENSGFGAGGRVSLKAIPGGEGAGSYGWSGAAGTTAFVDRERGVRGSGFVQFMPFGAVSFTADFPKSVYADIA